MALEVQKMNTIKNIWRKLAGKGYYIALILCALTIGISGYMYYRSASDQTQLPAPATDAVAKTEPDLSVIGPEPTQPTQEPTQPDPTQPSPEPLKTGRPVEGQTVLGYSVDCLCYNPTTRDWRTHSGIDIAAEVGAPVTAAADGQVYTTYQDDTMGTTVVIRHADGYVTTYSSLDGKLEVTAGETVKLGQTIGYVGTSAMMEYALGDHVHFSVTKDDQVMDPEEFFGL